MSAHTSEQPSAQLPSAANDESSVPTGVSRTRTTRARSQRAVRNDRQLSKAALTELNLHGFDGLHMGAVANRAGLSSGAVYNRFENVAEMAVALWQEHLRDQALTMFDLMVDLGHQTFGEPIHPDLISQTTDPSPTWRGALELLLVARRVEELFEVITEDLRNWELRHGFVLEKDPIRYSLGVASLSPMVGLSVLQMLQKPVNLANEQIFRIHQGILESAWEYSEPPSTDAGAPEADFTMIVSTDDQVSDALINAAARVIATSGCVRSTVSRIARRAGYTTTAIYERYENKEALIMDTVRTALSHHLLITGQQNAEAVLDPGYRWLIPMTISQSLLPARSIRRRLRQELTLAGIHHPDIGAAVSEACTVSVEEVVRAVAPVTEKRANSPDVIASYIRSSVTGRDLLNELVPELHRADFRPYTDYLLDRALQLSHRATTPR
jgi:AcrR family transcriptional regulator